jgi:hypothetical protein
LFRREKKLIVTGVAALVCIGAISIDFLASHRGAGTSFSIFPDSAAAKTTSKAVVAIATSADRGLAEPVPLTAERVSFSQVDAVVRRALDMDTSETSIRKVIAPSDWVIMKLNLVHAPLQNDKGGSGGDSKKIDDFVWGDVTDARVVKSVVCYMVEKVKPLRITFVEGAPGWSTTRKSEQGSQNGNSQWESGWTVHWREFGNISYKELCDSLNAAQSHTTVDYVDLNEDKYRFEPVPGGAFQHENVKFRGGNFGYGALTPGTGTPRKGYFMPEIMLGPNKMVNIPAMKMNIGGGTLIFKNYVGAFASIPYGDGQGKGQMDKFGFSHGMVDIFSYKPTVYAVIGGFWASEKDWPTKTQNLHHNIVIAGGNPVATEATALRAMGVNPAEVLQSHLARLKGFGSWEEKDITVVGIPVRQVRRNFIKHSAYNGIGFQNYLMNGPWKETDLDKDLLGGEAKARPTDGDKSAGKRWWVFKHPYGFPEAYVSLNETIPDDLTNTITYAYLRLKSPARQEGIFTFGYDDGAKVYLNGKVIYRDDDPHEYSIREKAVPVVLEKGDNHLLIKLKNRFGEAGFASCIEDTAKTMLYDMEVVVPKEKGMAPPAGK